MRLEIQFHPETGVWEALSIARRRLTLRSAEDITSRSSPHPFPRITAQLPFLRELGITTLWLLPVSTPPPRGYTLPEFNYVALENGTPQGLKEFVRQAHGLMRFLENHNAVPAAQYFGVGLSQALMAICCLLQGVPLLYQEQETGFSHELSRWLHLRQREEERPARAETSVERGAILSGGVAGHTVPHGVRAGGAGSASGDHRCMPAE